MGEKSRLRATIAQQELEWMVMKDQYAEVARALGFEGDAWFGDPLVSHDEIVRRAQQLRKFSDRAEIRRRTGAP